MGAPIVGMPRFELQTKLPPRCCGADSGPHTVEGSADVAAGAAGEDVAVAGAAEDVASGAAGVVDVAAGFGAGGEVDVAGAAVVQDASRTRANNMIHIRLNLPWNNLFILYSLLNSFTSSCQFYV